MIKLSRKEIDMHSIPMEERGDIVILRLDGPLDPAHANALQHDLAILLTAGWKKVIIDMNEVSAILSYGCGTLTHLIKEAKQNGMQMKFFGFQPEPKAVLERNNIDKILPCYATEEEAIASFSS